jgi:hypothetical protein
MDRRLFLTGLLGAVGATAAVAALPRAAHALIAEPETASPRPSPVEPAAGAENETQVAWHRGYPHGPARRHRRRVRRRVRRYRRVCRSYRTPRGWVRRCRRVPYWAWVW